MLLDSLLETGIVVSKSTRWVALYRKIHNMFIARELTHVQDVKLAVKMLDTRITTLETSMNAAISALDAAIGIAILNHNHIAPQAPAGAIPTSPGTPTGPVPPTPQAKTPVVSYSDAFMKAEDVKYFAMGPSAAPYLPGQTLDDVKAAVTIATDIGI